MWQSNASNLSFGDLFSYFEHMKAFRVPTLGVGGEGVNEKSINIY